jgi:DNA-binding response OmpR family regulator
MFTARESDIDQVIGLEAGADDYVTKPVEPIVLLARTRALLRRLDSQPDPPASGGDIVLGQLKISESSHRVWLAGEEIALTTQEFELLLVLARSAGTILTRDDLFRITRGIDYNGLDRSIDGRMSRLRKKLKDNPLSPARIRTVWGKGYLLVPDAWDETP